MKRINKMIRNTVIEIIIVIIMVITSIPVWKSFNLSEYETIAAYYGIETNTTFEVADFSDYVLYQVEDALALESIKPINIKLSNNSQQEENYNLYLVADKNSTLDYNLIKIYYLGEIKTLSDLTIIEDEQNYYFSLSQGSISNSVINNEILLWINSTKNGDIHNKFFSFDIINSTGQVL